MVAYSGANVVVNVALNLTTLGGKTAVTSGYKRVVMLAENIASLSVDSQLDQSKTLVNKRPQVSY